MAVQEWPGVAKLLISAHFRSFPIIALVDAGDGRLGLRLRLHRYSRLLSSWEKGPTEGSYARFLVCVETTGGGVNPEPYLAPCLASFTPNGEAGNEATVASFGTPLTRMRRDLAEGRLMTLVGLVRRGNDGGVKLLIQLHLIAFRCIPWPRLLLTERLEMRPPWPRLALRSLVCGGPAGPGCDLGWPRQEWPGVAKLLIQLHLIAFRCIPYRLRGRWSRGCA